jgi:hypothetical protein
MVWWVGLCGPIGVGLIRAALRDAVDGSGAFPGFGFAPPRATLGGSLRERCRTAAFDDAIAKFSNRETEQDWNPAHATWPSYHRMTFISSPCDISHPAWKRRLLRFS